MAKQILFDHIDRILGSIGYKPVKDCDPGIMFVRSPTPLQVGDRFNGRPILGLWDPSAKVYNAEGEGPHIGITYTAPELMKIHAGYKRTRTYLLQLGEDYRFVTIFDTIMGQSEVGLIHLARGEQGLDELFNLKGPFDKAGNPTDDNARRILEELFSDPANLN